MFTGIIEGVGTVRAVSRTGDGARIEIACDFDLEKWNVGDSIAVNGCCLTVTSRLGKSFWADLSSETLDATTLGDLRVGSAVNLERPLQLGGRLGGHLVQGHVDGVGKILKINNLDRGRELLMEIPGHLARYVVEKGSITVDGVSLTVNHCAGNQFRVMIVPHTELRTTFSGLAVGERVNLEVDIIGKYVEKLTFLDSEQYQRGTDVTREFLKKHGF